MAGLNEGNFLVYENGQPQKIATFATTDVPFEIALLLDTSGSTRSDVDLIRQAANSFVAALRPGDRVAIVAFNTARRGQSLTAKVDVLTTLTEDRKVLARAIENLGTSNGTRRFGPAEWRWEMTVQPTQVATIRRIDVRVFAEADRDTPLAQLSGLAGQDLLP